jgi:hypothetical protein
VKNKITSFQRRWARFIQNEVRTSVEDGVVPPRYALGLIQERGLMVQPLTIRYQPKLVLQPGIGPLNKGILPFEEREYTLPILAQSYDFDRPDLKVRFPSSKVKSKFRFDFLSKKLGRMGTGEIYSPSQVLCSITQDEHGVEVDNETKTVSKKRSDEPILRINPHYNHHPGGPDKFTLALQELFAMPSFHNSS